jgi:hypothetical protein
LTSSIFIFVAPLLFWALADDFLFFTVFLNADDWSRYVCKTVIFLARDSAARSAEIGRKRYYYAIDGL